MDDQNKPASPAGGSISPLSPQIKTSPQPLNSPPSSLPTRPLPSTSTTQFQAPPVPSQPTFKSSIRTMQEDMSAIKKGETPTGIQIEKQPEKEIKPISTPEPKITPPPPKPVSKIELGEPEKAKPIGGIPLPSLPSLAKPVPLSGTIKIPETGKKFPAKTVIIILALLIVAGGLTWFYIFRKPVEPGVVLTETPTPVLTSTPLQKPPLESVFNVVSQVDLVLSGGNIFPRLENSVDKNVLVSGEPGLYKTTATFESFMSAAIISLPQDISPFIDDKGFYLTLQRKTDGKYSYGFITQLKTTTGIDSALKTWETSLSKDLKDLFLLGSAKASSADFLDNTYQGVSIRYKNFPDPNKTIDYAVITRTNGDQYLLFTNSKEHMFALIDELFKVVSP